MPTPLLSFNLPQSNQLESYNSAIIFIIMAAIISSLLEDHYYYVLRVKVLYEF